MPSHGAALSYLATKHGVACVVDEEGKKVPLTATAEKLEGVSLGSSSMRRAQWLATGHCPTTVRPAGVERVSVSRRPQRRLPLCADQLPLPVHFISTPRAATTARAKVGARPSATTFSTASTSNDVSAPNLNPVGSLDDAIQPAANAKNCFNQDADTAFVKALKDGLGGRSLSDPTLFSKSSLFATWQGIP